MVELDWSPSGCHQLVGNIPVIILERIQFSVLIMKSG